jgi:hypothetical protein
VGGWEQAGSARAVQLVRIVEPAGGNRYAARPVDFDESGELQVVGSAELEVMNLAEPPGGGGAVPADTDALAVDCQGRWIIFIRNSAGAFPAKIISASGEGLYVVREQVVTAGDTFTDAAEAVDLDARNLAELSLGPGSAVDVGTIVLVHMTLDQSSPPGVHYMFDHPAYAKYLD